MKDLISRQAAIDAECEVCQIAPKKERRHNCTYYVHGCKEIECLRALPSAQPDYEKIIAEIKQCILETREHGKHHAKFVQDNGELYISGLEMALSIIEENR